MTTTKPKLEDLRRMLAESETAPGNAVQEGADIYRSGGDGDKFAVSHRGKSAAADLKVRMLKQAIEDEEASVIAEVVQERRISPRVKVEPSADEEMLRRRINAAIDSTERIDQETADRVAYERAFEAARAKLDDQKWKHQCKVEAENNERSTWVDPMSTFVADLTPDEIEVLKYGQPNRLFGNVLGESATIREIEAGVV